MLLVCAATVGCWIGGGGRCLGKTGYDEVLAVGVGIC